MSDRPALNQEVLLVEYQVTQQYIDMVERARWSGTAVIIGSLVIGATLTTVWNQAGATAWIRPEYASIGAAIVALFVAGFWWSAMLTWRHYQQISFDRMRQIETILDIRKNRMIEEQSQHIRRVHKNLGSIIFTVSVGWAAILIASLVSIFRR